MTLGDRVRNDPIRALAWIEAAACLLAAAADISLLLTLTPAQETPDRRIYIVTALVSAVCATATFSIPHASNRRYVLIGIALLSLCAVGWLPPDALLLFVLAATLAARLTFAFGFRGAVAAWATACIALGLRSLSAAYGPVHVAAGQKFDVPAFIWSVLPTAILLALIFAIIGVMKVYAASSAEGAATRERARIALDLHDFLGHGLTTLRVQLQNAERYRASDARKADDYVRRAVESSGVLLADVRETVTLLHDDAERTTPSFAGLFNRLCSDFDSTHDAIVEWNLDVAREPSGRISVELYRMIQEALTNVARHARASHVWIRVCGDGRTVEATIEDDGIGVALGDAPGHGLISMRERITRVNGQFSISRRDERGTIVRAVVPVEAT
jgi:signal transduction histidine kinase